MKKLSIYTLVLALAVLGLQACGPSEEERRAAEQARLDSLRQVEQQRIQEMMQAREDSLARLEAQQEEEKEEKATGQFSEDGNYIVQVGAFRSEGKAEQYKQKLSDRNFPNVYIIKVGEEETGDIWFRLRIGFFDTKEAAEALGAELASELNSGYWASKVQR